MLTFKESCENGKAWSKNVILRVIFRIFVAGSKMRIFSGIRKMCVDRGPKMQTNLHKFRRMSSLYIMQKLIHPSKCEIKDTKLIYFA